MVVLHSLESGAPPAVVSDLGGHFSLADGFTNPLIYRAHEAQAHHDLDRMFVAGKKVLRKHFQSDPARYQRALGSWYALHAKARWNNGRLLKTGVFLAFAGFHGKMARLAAHFPPSRGISKPPESSLQRALPAGRSGERRSVEY